MPSNRRFPILAALLAGLMLPASGVVTIDWVTVGDINNPADPDPTCGGHGAVGYQYNIGKYEVTIGQYTEFLNAVAQSDGYGLYDPDMGTDVNVAGITRSGSDGSYSYATTGSANRPITYVSWFDAARFCNWLHNGQGSGSTEAGAYNLNGATSGIFTVQPGANVWIPSEDEWYKAAYYQPAAQGGDTDSYWLYPTASNTLGGNTPGTGAANYHDGDYATTQSSDFSSSQNYLTDVGDYQNSDSHYGIFDMGGNVWEWTDSIDSGSARWLRGGSWRDSANGLQASYSGSYASVYGSSGIGFRLAAVPEPSLSLGMAILLGLGLAPK